MVQFCCVLGCKNRSDVKPNLTFHSFPKDDTLYRLWINATGRKNWLPTPNNRICSEHFDEELFRKTQRLTFLKASTPSLNVHSPQNNSDEITTNKSDSKNQSSFAIFKMLMNEIMLNAKAAENPKLQILIDKAWDMVHVLGINKESIDPVKQAARDLNENEEINDDIKRKVLKREAEKNFLSEPNDSPKRVRTTHSTPKILNTFSMATKFGDDNCNSSNLIEDFESHIEDAASSSVIEEKSTKSDEVNLTLNNLPSFNDSYREFIDQTMKGAAFVGKKLKPGRHKSDACVEYEKPTNQFEPQLLESNVKDISNTAKDSSETHTVATLKPIGLDTILKVPTKMSSGSFRVYASTDRKFNISPSLVQPVQAVRKLNSNYKVRQQENDCNILVLEY